MRYGYAWQYGCHCDRLFDDAEADAAQKVDNCDDEMRACVRRRIVVDSQLHKAIFEQNGLIRLTEFLDLIRAALTIFL